MKPTGMMTPQTVIEAARAGGATRVVHCSTVGVHGDVEHPPANEDAPLRPGDIYQTYFDYSTAERVLGWKPEVSFAEGVKIIIDFFRQEL